MPNRIIKESICRSDSIDSLSWFEEVLFYRLIVVCDDYGRFDGRAAIIRGSCFPLKDMRLEQIEDALERLAIAGMIRRYKTEDGAFLQLTAWSKHQQTRAVKSKYPDPDDNVKNQSPGGSDTGLYIQKKSSETVCNQLISDDSICPRNRESVNENRETVNGDAGAREAEEVRRFEDFLAAYPKDCNRHLTETEYCALLLTGKVAEDDLVQCAVNYAESCKALKTNERYIKNAENFLKDMAFDKYLPEKYKKPVSEKPKNGFNRFPQRDYDFKELEEKLLRAGGGNGRTES